MHTLWWQPAAAMPHLPARPGQVQKVQMGSDRFTLASHGHLRFRKVQKGSENPNSEISFITLKYVICQQKLQKKLIGSDRFR